MRYLLYFFLCTISSFAQRTNISVVSAEKLNVVYRGVPNPIKIAVPGAKSFTATAPGLKAVDSLGNYTLSAGQGNEVTVNIEAVMADGSLVKEEKLFRIKGLPAPTVMLYGQEGLVRLTKQELIEGVIEIDLIDFLFDVQFEVSHFSLVLKTGKRIDIEGKKMNQDAIAAIKKLKNNEEVIIDFVKSPFIQHKRIYPIAVIIIDKH